ncbi:SusC/RagA family TonB-linked outer membrane protein [Echinicola marina]|uniref:SusC/RagA family TonB-linked outer membrane protein n=1 Tax=Echinicola marina TaxID=2859768 RepID=UPI001CF6B7CC|nr:SusC/RagA family TonB-linked outer membrane protein [Echinicola marina]UCS95041.1 SusC/RagA family TonB-linked outer membrane protein [Echinicola marina]
MKRIIPFLLYACLLPIQMMGQTDGDTLRYRLEGRVFTVENEPMPGATVSMEGSSQGTVTGEDGGFQLALKPGQYTITVHFLGFQKVSRKITVPSDSPITITMREDGLDLEQVEVLSTGYQKVPRERATGSFSYLDEKLLLRNPGMTLLDRMEDITSGLIYNRTGPPEDRISIRGRSTLFANATPLIIIDNFPYDGPLENINPNDVASITVLKDAAAASIWGARAGNGVIVITTKRGSFDQGMQVGFTANMEIGEKRDLHYIPQMDMGDFIETERMLFDQGYYQSAETSRNKTMLSPVVETLIAMRDGMMSNQEGEDRIAAFKQNDIRNDLERFYYKNTFRQQYALNVSGGSSRHRYVVSGGYDQAFGQVIGDMQNRYTFNLTHQWKAMDDNLKLNASLYYVGTSESSDTSLPDPYPYESLVDSNDRPQRIYAGFSDRFIRSIEGSGLLDWTYTPLEEIGLDRKQSSDRDLRANLSMEYDLSPSLSLSTSYQYWQANGESSDFSPQKLFSTRNLINQFTQVEEDVLLYRAIPDGGILDRSFVTSNSHNVRFQADYHHKWAGRNELSAIAGYELKDYRTAGTSTRFYGYDDVLGISVPVDYITRFTRFHNNRSASIPNSDGHFERNDHYLSAFFNSAYTYKGKYILSASVRRDASNLFGVDTNQKWVPLWSLGGSWLISEEEFFHSGFLPFLRLRSTFGYNGNMDRSVSARTTAFYTVGGVRAIIPGNPYGVIVNPPNPELRWEKIAVWNLGLDFETKNNILSGSLEFYKKSGKDLIGDTAIPSSTGWIDFRGNYAGTTTSGVDFILNSKNLGKKLQWDTQLLFSALKEKVTDYTARASVRSYMLNGAGSVYPLEGRPLFALYSYPWAGLDPDTGEPMGYLDGEESKDYNAIIDNTTAENIHYNGPARPTVFGGLRNTFSYGGFSLSVNISYRLGYYYRRSSVSYYNLLSGQITHGDYDRRWLRPGDESMTQIPSMPDSRDANRRTFYQFSDILVEKGDHIRLKDVRLGYRFVQDKQNFLPFNNAELFIYANNLGIIWKAAKEDPMDPDFRTAKPLRSMALGIKIDF